MCVDSAVKPDDMQGPPVGLWPCHQQGGNQVHKDNFFNHLSYTLCIFNYFNVLIVGWERQWWSVITKRGVVGFRLGWYAAADAASYYSKMFW